MKYLLDNKKSYSISRNNWPEISFKIGLKYQNSKFYWFFKRLAAQKKLKQDYSLKKFKHLVESALGCYDNFDLESEAAKNQIIIRADKILQKEVVIFGYEYSGEKIDWHTDFISGFEWPRGKFFRKYRQVDHSNNADVKVPRELSRSHQFLHLGLAYLLTKDEKYALEFITQLDDWIDENPLMYSINWGCTMDVAIRAINWIVAYNMFSRSPSLTPDFQSRFINSLYEHGWFIYSNPETNYFNNGNHYVSDLAGQLLLGLIFYDNPQCKVWLDQAKDEIIKEIRSQILPSGVNYEKSINYIRLQTELFTFCYILLKRAGIYIPPDVRYRVESQFEFIANYLKPDGTAPVIGDQDDGRLLPFGLEENIDHRYLLSIGSVLFNRPDLKAIGGGYYFDVYFWTCAESALTYENIPETKIKLKSRSFIDAGYFIMRNTSAYTLINNSGPSMYFEQPMPAGIHSHADLLSFELAVGERTFLTDAGGCLYSSNTEIRNLFRSTRMHNTVTIDGMDQYEINPKYLFTYASIAFPKLNTWISNDQFDLFDGEHDGYMRLEDPVTHRRKIHFDKINDVWKIDDILTGKEKHDMSIFFHFDYEVDFEIIYPNMVKTILKGEKNILMIFDNFDNMKISKFDSWISKKYGHKMPNKSLHIKLPQANFPLKFTTKIELVD